MQEYFDEERQEIVEAVEALDYAGEAENAIQQILDNRKEHLFNTIFAIRFEAVSFFGTGALRDVLELAEERSAPTPTGKAEFDPWDESVQDWLRHWSSQNVTHIDDTTRFEIRDLVWDAHEENRGAMWVAEQIDELYLEKVIPNRSEVIARTETMQAASFGSWAGAVRAKVPNMGKFWITARDDRVREHHMEMETHEVIPLGDYFRVGADMMKFPLDPNSSAENVIQCRCVLGYEYLGEPVVEKDPVGQEALVELRDELRDLDSQRGYSRMQKHFDEAVEKMREEGLSDKEIAERLWGGVKGKQGDHPLPWLRSGPDFGEHLTSRNAWENYFTPGNKGQVSRSSKFFAEQIDQSFLGNLHNRPGAYINDWDPRFRGSYHPVTREIVWDGTGKTLVHEYSHHIHHMGSEDGLKGYIAEFFHSRARGTEMTAIYAGTKEMGYRDAFFDHYVGRVYPGGMPGAEVLTMGLQECMTAASRAKLFSRDPGHFQLMAAIARGVVPW